MVVLSSHQRPWMQNAASAWRSHPKGRSAAEQPRSGLTAPGRCGRWMDRQTSSAKEPRQPAASPPRGFERGEVFARRCRLRMIRPVARLENRQRAATKRLCLAETVRAAKQTRKIVETNRYVRMVSPVAHLANGQRTPHQRLGLIESVQAAKNAPKVVEVRRHNGMIRPVVRLIDRQRAATKWLGFGVTRFRLKQRSKVVEEPCGRFGGSCPHWWCSWAGASRSRSALLIAP